MKNRVRKDNIAAYLFLAPALILFTLFIFVPAVSVIYLSFTKYNVISPAKFVGFSNWLKIFTNDPRLWKVFGNSVKFSLLLAPMHMCIGLLLAYFAYSVVSKFRMSVYRMVIYFPAMIAVSSAAIAWTFIFSKDLGMLNYYLKFLGIPATPWLASSYWVYPAVMIFSLWKNVGVYFLYFLIAMQNVDSSLLEAAEIDGASSFQRFFKVTLPMISPTIFFVLTTMLIGVIQIFDEPYLMTNGGPGDSSRTISHYIYESAYVKHSYGYASAVALVLLVVVLIITFVQFRLQDKWVNYDNE